MANVDSNSPPERKKFRDVLLTSTPVVLTVIGTLLAGLANSEMTQAQYRRSLAAQFQSKTSDQWNFFQAKRIRRTSLEVAVGQVPALIFAGEWGPDRIVMLSERLAFAHRQTAEKLKAVCDCVELGPKKGEESEFRAVLRKVTETRILSLDEKNGTAAFATELAKSENQQAWAYLGTDKLPSSPTAGSASAGPEASAVAAALADVLSRKPEEASALHFVGLDREAVRRAIQDAIDRSEARAKEFDELLKPIQGLLRIIEKQLAHQLREAERLHRTNLALEPFTEEGYPALQQALQRLQIADRELSRVANESKQAVEALKDDFDLRRYKVESDDNKAIAEHFEVMVRFQGAISERHRLRSRQFFYGMLCAQAGVVIASTALAARHKSVLWSLAALAGATALCFAVYVYLWV